MTQKVTSVEIWKRKDPVLGSSCVQAVLPTECGGPSELEMSVRGKDAAEACIEFQVETTVQASARLVTAASEHPTTFALRLQFPRSSPTQ